MDIISHGMNFYKVKIYLRKKYLRFYLLLNNVWICNKNQQTGNHINAV